LEVGKGLILFVAYVDGKGNAKQRGKACLVQNENKQQSHKSCGDLQEYHLVVEFVLALKTKLIWVGSDCICNFNLFMWECGAI